MKWLYMPLAVTKVRLLIAVGQVCYTNERHVMSE